MSLVCEQGGRASFYRTMYLRSFLAARAVSGSGSEQRVRELAAIGARDLFQERRWRVTHLEHPSVIRRQLELTHRRKRPTDERQRGRRTNKQTRQPGAKGSSCLDHAARLLTRLCNQNLGSISCPTQFYQRP